MLNFILNSKNVNKSSYIWNALGGMLNSIQSPLLLILIARGSNGVNDAAIFVIAYAIGNLMMMIGKYGVRNYHVTDVNSKYSFADYLSTRKITVLIMAIVSVFYVMFSNYDYEKTLIVILICIMKAFDSYEDVIHSEFQRCDRLDIAGKILGIRLIYYFVCFALLYICTDNLLITTASAVISSLIIGSSLDIYVWNKMNIEYKSKSWRNVLDILKACFPLFLCTYLAMYIANAPKYIVDGFYSSDIQASFNYVFMPVFVIALFGNFIFQPMQTKASNIYALKEYSRFNRLIIKGIIQVVVITCIIAVGGYFVGIPVMSVVFNHNLTGYELELVMLIITGGGLALINMLNMFISLIRYQKHMIISYAIAALIMKVIGDMIAKKYEVITLTAFYCCVVFLLMLELILVLLIGIKRNKCNEDRRKA